MPRFFPRRTRQLWVAFLLAVCLVGIYITYIQLSDSEKKFRGRDSKSFPHLHDALDLENTFNKRMKSLNGNLKNIPLDVQPDLKAAVRSLENDQDYISEEERMSRIKSLLVELSPSNWKFAPDAGDMILKVKNELMDLGFESEMSCRQISDLKIGGSRTQSFYGKKAVDRAFIDYTVELVVKSLGADHPLKIECMKDDYNSERCAAMGNYKIMRELVLLLTLDSPSIIGLKGFCLRGETVDPRLSKKGVVIVTEAGRPIGTSLFDSFTWRERVEVAYKLLKLLELLETGPLGSLRLQKLHLPDVVYVEQTRTLKLVDLDNIFPGEMQCKTDQECRIPEMGRAAIKCMDGHCVGRNALNNLLWVYRIFLHPLFGNEQQSFREAPSRRFMHQWLMGIQDLKYSMSDVLNQLLEWRQIEENKIKDAGFQEEKEKEQRRLDEIKLEEMRKAQDKEKQEFLERQNEMKNEMDEQENVKPSYNKETAPKVTTKATNKAAPARESETEYIRKDQSNYPGMFDYTCGISRVSWGCVVSVRNLREAYSHCDLQDQCKSFVLFTSNPDGEALMTMVMKNSADIKPEPNYGATLFIKKPKSKPETDDVPQLDTALKSDDGARPAVKKEHRGAGLQSDAMQGGHGAVTLSESIPECEQRVLNITRSARDSRERRLMTHLGLKGMKERSWIKDVKTMKVSRHYGPSKLSPENQNGARFKFSFADSAPPLTKGEFIVEKGPLHYHVAYMMAYLLDRQLGLYSIPPSVGRNFTLAELQEVEGDTTWLEVLSTQQSEDEVVRGVISVPVPQVMKSESFDIPSLSGLPNTVTPFSRTEKTQFEYLLLWSLTNLMQPQHGYLGYKGHLIHFEADLAFQNPRQSLVSYMYNCQFPSIVYKSLNCFRCPTTRSKSSKSPMVCGLGQMIVKKMRHAGFSEKDMQLGNLQSTDLLKMINTSAGSMLTEVDKCIRQFSRDKVLY